MARRAQPFYYLKRPRVVGYGAFDKVLANPRVAETIVEAEALDDLLPRAARVAAVASGDETVELLYTLAVAAELGRDAVRGARPKRDLQGPTLAGQATSG
jgi:hypothetical protein